jgi:hypothetical protein
MLGHASHFTEDETTGTAWVRRIILDDLSTAAQHTIPDLSDQEAIGGGFPDPMRTHAGVPSSDGVLNLA